MRMARERVAAGGGLGDPGTGRESHVGGVLGGAGRARWQTVHPSSSPPSGRRPWSSRSRSSLSPMGLPWRPMQLRHFRLMTRTRPVIGSKTDGVLGPGAGVASGSGGVARGAWLAGSRWYPYVRYRSQWARAFGQMWSRATRPVMIVEHSSSATSATSAGSAFAKDGGMSAFEAVIELPHDFSPARVRCAEPAQEPAHRD